MLTSACFVRLSLAFGALPIFGCGWVMRRYRRCAVGLVGSALIELFIIEIPMLVGNVCLFSAWREDALWSFIKLTIRTRRASSFILFIICLLGLFVVFAKSLIMHCSPTSACHRTTQ